MKKSKPESSVKKPKAASLKSKKKRKTSPRNEGSSKIVKKDQAPRKSRWEEATKLSQDLKKTATSTQPQNMEKEDIARESSRIKSLLDDKKKIVEQLFVTVSGKTLDDLIPDYLRKRPIDELKKLCLIELEKMTNDEILQIISGKGHPLFKEQETQTEFSENPTGIVAPAKENIKSEKENEHLENVAFIEEMNVINDQNQTPPEILDEVAKDLGTSEGDAELLELEMRARAIRSLLKLKPNEECNIDSNLFDDK